jgi:WD40 repeat protein
VPAQNIFLPVPFLTDTYPPGYAVWNLVEIIKELRGELSGLDLSRLDLSGVGLNGVRCSRFYDENYLLASFCGSRVHEKSVLPQGHTNRVLSAVYSPDGKKILSTSNDKTVKEWDAGTGQCLKTWKYDDPNIPRDLYNDTIKKFSTFNNKIPLLHRNKIKKELINVPGLWIQGCDFSDLEEGSVWSKKGLEIMKKYHARLSIGEKKK